MSVLYFKAGEILAMAIGIEERGAEFYRRAAKTFPSLAAVLEDLATMEDRHREIFLRMQDLLEEGERMEVGEETALYLSSWADSQLFRESPEEAFKGIGDEKALLRKAMALERDSIAFYLGFSGLVPSGWGKERVEEVINEEKGHLKTLAERLREGEGGEHGRI